MPLPIYEVDVKFRRAAEPSEVVAQTLLVEAKGVQAAVDRATAVLVSREVHIESITGATFLGTIDRPQRKAARRA